MELKPTRVIRVALDSISGPIEARRIEVIVDLDDQGTLVGIEILEARRQRGVEAIQLAAHLPLEEAQLFSYDAEADAVYLRLARARSVDQRAWSGVVLINDKRGLLALELEEA